MARGGLAQAGVVCRAHGGARPPGRLGEDLRASARADLADRRPGALPADDDGRRARGRAPSDGRLRRSQPADVRTRRRCAASRRRDHDGNEGHRRDARRRARCRCRDRPRCDRDRGRRQRGRHVRARDRGTRRCERADRADGARVPRDQAGRSSARDAHDARSVAARVLPSRVRRADHGRLRAPLRALGPRRDPRRLQLEAARRGLAPVRGAHGERGRPRAVARRDGGREAHQRAGGVHTGRRVRPRALRCSRLLGRGGVLRPRPRRSGRHGQARRRVDRRGHAVPRRLAHGLAPFRRRLPEPGVHPRAHEGDLRDVLRRQVPGSRALGRAAPTRVERVRTSARARCGLRGEVGLGARQLVRAQRGPGRRVAAPARLGGEAVVARHRCGARRVPRVGGDLRRDVVREARGERRGRSRVPRAPLLQPRRARCRPGDVHADAQREGRNRVRLHRHASRRGQVPHRHGHGVRAARPGVAPPACTRGRVGPRRGRDVPVRVLRGVGAQCADAPPAADHDRPLERVVSGTCVRESSRSAASRALRCA